MTIFVEIAREGGVRLLIDRETLKEYPLTLNTVINIANHLNDELLDFDDLLINVAKEYDKTDKKEEKLILGHVPVIQFNTIANLMPKRTELHNKSNEKIHEEFGAFDKEGKFKGYKKDVDVKLIEEIRHTLVSLSGLKAFDSLGDNVKSNDSHVSVLISELIPLNFEELIKEIDEVLE